MVERFSKVSLAQFRRLARELADKYGYSSTVIGLIGPLGGGKTTFVKNFAAALGIKKTKSPTFTIVDSYRLGKRLFHHIDLYRLDRFSELRPLGIVSMLGQKHNLVIIEWLDKFPRLKRYCDLIIKISFTPKPQYRNVAVYKN